MAFIFRSALPCRRAASSVMPSDVARAVEQRPAYSITPIPAAASRACSTCPGRPTTPCRPPLAIARPSWPAAVVGCNPRYRQRSRAWRKPAVVHLASRQGAMMRLLLTGSVRWCCRNRACGSCLTRPPPLPAIERCLAHAAQRELANVRSAGDAIHRLGERQIAFGQSPCVVRGERHLDPVPDIGPLGMVVHLLGDERDPCHEAEAFIEILEHESALDGVAARHQLPVCQPLRHAAERGRIECLGPAVPR